MGKFEFRYVITIHVATGVTIAYETNENINFKKVLKKTKDVFVIEGSPNSQAIPIRSILVVEVLDKELQPEPVVAPAPLEPAPVIEPIPKNKKTNQKKKKQNGAKK